MKYLNVLKQKLEEHDILLALTVVICFLGLTLFIGSYSNRVIPGNPAASARYSLEPQTHLDFLSEWDGPHYLHIAKYGYTNNSLTAFFPLYPLLIRLVNFIVPSVLISALLISWGSLLGAVYLFIKIIKYHFGDNKSDIIRGLLLFLFFPTAVFFASTYTESLFIMLSLGAYYFALKNRLIAATFMCLLATATHPDGIFVIPLMALVFLNSKRQLWQIMVSAIAGFSGILAYILYLWITKHHALDFVHAQEHSHWLSHNYFNTIISSIGYIDLIILVAAVAAVIYWWKRNIRLAIYGLLFVLLPFVGGNFAGFGRYALIDFPIPLMLLALFKRSLTIYPLVLTLSVTLWSFYVIHYAAGYIGG